MTKAEHQRRYRAKLKAAGLCAHCTLPTVRTVVCDVCAMASVARRQNPHPCERCGITVLTKTARHCNGCARSVNRMARSVP